MWLNKNNFLKDIKKKVVKKKTLVHVFFVVWIIFSVSYIVYDQWTIFQNETLQKAYLAGRVDFVDGFIIEADKENCKVVTVYAEEKEVNVINIECLETKEVE